MSRRVTSLTVKLVGLLSVLALAVMACGQAATPTTAPTKPAATATKPPAATSTTGPVATATPVPPTPTKPAPTSTAAPTVKRGGTIVLPNSAELSGVDPSKVSNYTTFYMLPIWNQLVVFGNKSWSDHTVVGDLATSWTISPDGKTYTFKLDPNAKWQNIAPVNGRALIAQDVKWYFDLLRNPDYKSQHGAIMIDVDTIDAVDNQTVKFNLKAPFAGFANALANPRLKVLAKEVYDKDGGFDKTAVGSGPWQYKSYERGTRVVNVKNPVYWKMGVDGKALPYTDEVDIVIVPSVEAHMAGLRSGQFAFETPGGLDLPSITNLRKQAPDLVVKTDYKLYAFQLFINLKKEPFASNLKLRQAITKAINQNVLLTNAVGEPDAPWESPVTSGLSPYTLSQDELKQRLAYDLPGAKKLVAEANLPANFSMEIWRQHPRGTSVPLDTFPAILQQQFADAGLKSTIAEPSTQAEAYAKIFNYTYDVAEGTIGFEGDIYNVFRAYWLPNGSQNKAGVNDPKLTKMIADFDATVDQTQSAQISQDIQRYLLDNAYVVPLVSGRMYLPYQPWFKGFSRSWPWGFNGLESAWIDK